MCAVFFVRKIDTVYENINQITVVFQTINISLNEVVEKENYFVLCRYPMEDFFFCNILSQQLLLLLAGGRRGSRLPSFFVKRNCRKQGGVL